MEVRRAGGQQLIFFSVAITYAVVCFWWLAAQQGCCYSLALLLALLVSSVTVFCLDLLSFFHVIRPYPRKSDLLFVLFVFPVVTVVAERFLSGFILHAPGIPLLWLVLSSLVLSVTVFLTYYLVTRYIGVQERRKTIVLRLTPIESIGFISRISQLGLAKYLRFISFEEFESRALKNAISNDVHLLVWSDRCRIENEATECLLRSHLAGVPIQHHQTVLDDLSGRIDLQAFDLWRFLSRAKPQTASVRLSWKIKDMSEPILALALGALLSPLMIAVAFAIRVSSRGPIIFSQQRVGMNGKIFTLYKFRTMVSDAETDGPQWSGEKDARITRLGAILRKTRLDELPQLYNIIVGEMSFCGPRPERPEMYETLTKHIEHFWNRTLVKPGITGWAQIQAGYAASIAESRKKLEYDLYYIQNMSPRLDIVILLYTFIYALGSHTPREQQERQLSQAPEKLLPRFAAAAAIFSLFGRE